MGVLLHKNNIRVSISLHSYGKKLLNFGHRVTDIIKGVHGNLYEVERAVGLYPAGGASDDFAKAKAYIPYAVTLELPPDSRSRSGFRISPEKIRSTGEEIFAGLTEVALTALKEPLGPDRSALMEERLRTVG